MNQKVSDPFLKQWAKNLYLMEKITELHGDAPTHNNGSQPIDGIFVSPSLQIKACGLLPFGFIHSDHRMLWIDLTETSVLGFNLPPLLAANARRLQCSDPRVRKRWVQLYKQFVIEHNLHLKAYDLEREMCRPLTAEMQHRLDSLMELRRRGIAYADNHCRKIARMLSVHINKI